MGVHDVEGGVHRLQADGVFARVADVALARLTLLGRDDDNAGHRARTIDRGGGAVLQDVEGLDIVGIEAGDGGGNQGGGVTGGEIVGGDVHDVFHDHTVHDPQRLGGAVDGGGAADADLRGRAERTGDVLHGDTGHTAFQGTGDVGDTVQLGLIGVHLHGGTGEHAAVHRGHTGDDRLLQHLGIRFQGDADIVLHRNCLLLVAHEGNHKVLGALRNFVQDKIAVQVCHGSDLVGAFHIHVCTHDGVSVVGGDHRTADRAGLRKGSCHA